MSRHVTFVSSSIAHRVDVHGMRCEFKRLVHAGRLSVSEYDTFTAWVDGNGGLTAALRTLPASGVITLGR